MFTFFYSQGSPYFYLRFMFVNRPNERKQQQHIYPSFLLRSAFNKTSTFFILKTYVIFILFLTACVLHK